MVYSTKSHNATVIGGTRQAKDLGGVLTYLRTAQGSDALAWIDKDGNSVTESQLVVLQAAACPPETPALARQENHHELVRLAAEQIAREEKTAGGSLGRPTGARFRTYQRLQRHLESLSGTLFESDDLKKAVDDIYRFPLQESATDALNRQLRSGASDAQLAELALLLRTEGRLCITADTEIDEPSEPKIICSLGIV